MSRTKPYNLFMKDKTIEQLKSDKVNLELDESQSTKYLLMASD